ncbi:MAG: segregation/condensation protein A [Syntrophomonadaceae bacterium]|nr:segregation/condensation protein A [Syntrophomonadaceae bacterium]
MSYVVDLESFHGPLDLLLYLIEENQLNIYDIPVATIGDQFIRHLQEIGSYELEDLGSFLLMASYLLTLKSKMLLPVNQLEAEENDRDLDEDPRNELVQQLINYKKYKEASVHLEGRLNGTVERVYYRKTKASSAGVEEIQASLNTLLQSYRNVMRNQLMLKHEYTLPDDDVDIEQKMAELVALLADKPEGCLFQAMFRSNSRKTYIAFFLALMELIRTGKVMAFQEENFSPIRVNLKG